MIMQIWKYPLEVTDDPQALTMPRAAKILLVREQAGTPVMWAEVQPEATQETRTFKVVGTGHPYTHNAHYVGSAFVGPFVWHVLEVK